MLADTQGIIIFFAHSKCLKQAPSYGSLPPNPEAKIHNDRSQAGVANAGLAWIWF